MQLGATENGSYCTFNMAEALEAPVSSAAAERSTSTTTTWSTPPAETTAHAPRGRNAQQRRDSGEYTGFPLVTTGLPLPESRRSASPPLSKNNARGGGNEGGSTLADAAAFERYYIQTLGTQQSLCDLLNRNLGLEDRRGRCENDNVSRGNNVEDNVSRNNNVENNVRRNNNVENNVNNLNNNFAIPLEVNNIPFQTQQFGPDFVVDPQPVVAVDSFNVDIDIHGRAVKVIKSLPKFQSNCMNPVIFLNRLERVFRAQGINLEHFLVCGHVIFEGAEANWFMIAVDGCRSYSDFRTFFLDEFWGAARQRELRWRVDSGAYGPTAGSYATYFSQLATEAQCLSPPYEESYLVRSLAAHFPSAIASRLAGVYTIPEATRLLRELEEINGRRTRVLPADNRDYRHNNRSGFARNNNPNTHANQTQNRAAVNVDSRPRIAALDEPRFVGEDADGLPQGN